MGRFAVWASRFRGQSKSLPSLELSVRKPLASELQDLQLETRSPQAKQSILGLGL